MSHYRYLLGDAAREAARLRAQARLWDPVSLALFDRIGGGLIALHDGVCAVLRGGRDTIAEGLDGRRTAQDVDSDLASSHRRRRPQTARIITPPLEGSAYADIRWTYDDVRTTIRAPSGDMAHVNRSNACTGSTGTPA